MAFANRRHFKKCKKRFTFVVARSCRLTTLPSQQKHEALPKTTFDAFTRGEALTNSPSGIGYANPRRFRKCKIFCETIGSGAVGQLQPPPPQFRKALSKTQFVFARTAVLGSPLRGNCYAIILPKSLPSATFVMTRSQEIRALINNQRRIACGNRRLFQSGKKL